MEWLWSMLAAWPATWLLIVLWASLRPHLCLAGILVMAGAVAVSPLAVPLPVTVAAAAALVASVFIAALLRAAAAREHEAVAPGPRSPADPRRGTSGASVTASPAGPRSLPRCRPTGPGTWPGITASSPLLPRLAR